MRASEITPDSPKKYQCRCGDSIERYCKRQQYIPRNIMEYIAREQRIYHQINHACYKDGQSGQY